MKATSPDPVPALLAEFDSPDRLRDAAARLRDLGYRRLELYSPFPLDGAESLLELRRPRWLPALVLAAGLAGAGGGYWVQWFTNAWDYPLNVGGRPLLAVPTWIPITFELGVLAAAFAAVLGLLASAGLPRLWRPEFTVPGFDRASVDRYWLAIGADDPAYEPARARRDIETLGPLRLVAPETVS